MTAYAYIVPVWPSLAPSAPEDRYRRPYPRISHLGPQRRHQV